MKLYFSPGACSLSPHIVLLEAGLSATMIKVDLGAKKTAEGADYLTVNSKGSVPALQLDDGTVLYDSPVICEYLDGLHGGPKLLPTDGKARILVGPDAYLFDTLSRLAPTRYYDILGQLESVLRRRSRANAAEVTVS